MRVYAQLLQKLSQDSMSIESLDRFFRDVSGSGECLDIATQLEILKLYDFPFRQNGNTIELSTATLDLQEAVFCFVDIETTGAKIEKHDIIEIGAVKYQNGKVIDWFESFVFAPYVPEEITKLTGIRTKDLSNAPQPQEILTQFRDFLRDSVFVAHNVSFDYNFLNQAFLRYGIVPMLLPKLCTIDLARKTILSPRYALGFLNAFLGINTPASHRAYADALTALEVFKIAMMHIPNEIQSIQNLLDFSKKGRKLLS